MKTKMLLTLTSTVLLTQTAYAKERVNRQEEKTFSCARDIIESHKTTKENLKQVASILHKASNEKLNKDVNDFINELPGFEAPKEIPTLQECLELKAIVEKQNNRAIESLYKDNLDLMNESEITANQQEVIRKILANTYMTCKTVGLTADIMIGVGAGAGARLGKCVMENGRSFLVTGYTLESGIGIFAGANISYSNHKLVKTDGTYDLSQPFLMGSLISFRSDRSEKDTGLGIGLGMAKVIKSNTKYFKILKTGNDFKDIKKSLSVHYKEKFVHGE